MNYPLIALTGVPLFASLLVAYILVSKEYGREENFDTKFIRDTAWAVVLALCIFGGLQLSKKAFGFVISHYPI